MKHLKQSIKLFAGYYRWEGQPIEDILKRWQEDGDKLYEANKFERMHGEEEFYHGLYDIYDILPYREYVWTKEDARRNPEEWEELKESLR